MIERTAPSVPVRLVECINMSVERLFVAANRYLAVSGPWAIACLSLMVVQVWMVFSHLGWQDEWQALLIAVQSPNLLALLANLRYEAHPPLWYFLLRAIGTALPFALILPALQAAIALLMQAMLLWRAPFSRFERLLIGSSYFILFEFGTLSRSLSLGAMLCVAFFAVKGRRAAWFILCLLPMVDIHFGIISLLLLVLLWRDGRWWQEGFAGWALCSLLSAIAVIPAPDMLPAQTPRSLDVGVLILLDRLSPMLVPIHLTDGRWHWNGTWTPAFGIFLGGPLFLLFALRLMRPIALHQWLFGALLLALSALSLFIYPLGVRHLSLLPLLLILLRWRQRVLYGPVEGGESGFHLWLLAIALCGLLAVGISINRPFDSARQVTQEIVDRGLSQRNWVAWPALHGTVVTALSGMEFQAADRKCTHSFLRWDRRSPIVSPARLPKMLNDRAVAEGRFYLLSLLPLEAQTFPVRLLSVVPAGYDGNDYYLYVIRPDLPDSVARSPQCDPPRLPFVPVISGL